MCNAFSCIVTKNLKVYWSRGKDSHEDILNIFSPCDIYLKDNKEPPDNTFARIEIVPPNGNYLNTDFNSWELMIDETIIPSWLSPMHREVARKEFKRWTDEVYSLFDVELAKKFINPLEIQPPEITEEHISLLKNWDSVRDLVGDSVRDSVRDSVGDSVRDLVWYSVRDLVGDSVGDLVGDSVVDLVGDLVWSYIGSMFKIEEWRYIDYSNPLFKVGQYPFQPAVDFWNQGFIPIFDGNEWMLYGDGKILWKGKI